MRIGDGVAEEVEEGGLEEGVELGEGLAALGPQGVRRIQYPRNPLLLSESGKWDVESGKLLRTQSRKIHSDRKFCGLRGKFSCSEKMKQVIARNPV